MDIRGEKRQKKITDLYTDFLMTSTSGATATTLSSILNDTVSHDSITRFLSQEETFTPKDYWKSIKPVIREHEKEDVGILSFDDTIIDKSSMHESSLVCYHYDHTTGKNVKGINLLSCVYTRADKDITIPLEYTPVEKPMEYCDIATKKRRRMAVKTKNDYFRHMFQNALLNNVAFSWVVADAWFCSKKNIRYIHKKNKFFVVGVRSNTLVTETKYGSFVRVDALGESTDTAAKVWMKDVPFPVLFVKKVFTNKDGSSGTLYLVSNALAYESDPGALYAIYQKRWKIEEYHKSLKNNASIGKSQASSPRAQRNHLYLAICAFVKYESLKIATHLNHFALKSKIYVTAMRAAMEELQTLKVKCVS